MDNTYNINEELNINLNQIANQNIFTKSFNEPYNIIFDKDTKNFNQKKRKRNNYDLNNKRENQFYKKFDSLESKFLSYKEFKNKIKDELKFHKNKRKDIFDNDISMIFPEQNNSNNLLLLTNINYNDSTKKENNNTNNKKNNNIKNDGNIFIYKTDKKLNNIKHASNYRDINASQEKLLVPLSSFEKKRDNNIKFNKEGNDIIINDIKIIPFYYKNRKKMIKHISICLLFGITIISFVFLI